MICVKIARKYKLDMVPVNIYFPLHKVAQQEARKKNITLEWNPLTKKWMAQERHAHLFEVVKVDGQKYLKIELI